MSPLVDLDRPAIGILHDDTAIPGHLLVLCEQPHSGGRKLLLHVVE